MKANIICAKHRPKVITEIIIWEIIHYIDLIRLDTTLIQPCAVVPFRIQHKSFTFNIGYEIKITVRPSNTFDATLHFTASASRHVRLLSFSSLFTTSSFVVR